MTPPWVQTLLDRAEPGPPKWASPAAMATGLAMPMSDTTPALRVIDQALVDVAADPSQRLAIFMSPQEGKSRSASHKMPLWLLANHPGLRIALVSYDDTRAQRWGRAIRRDLRSYPQLGVTLASDSTSVGRFETSAGGMVICVGINSGLTGEPVDCLRGDTLITTDVGDTSIRDLHRSDPSGRPRVLTVNHSTGLPEWKPIRATRAVPDRPLLQVVTSGGRRFTCTPDHRVHTQDGYRPAALLRPGDRLTVGRADDQQGVRVLRQGAGLGSADLLGVLLGRARHNSSDAVLHPVQDAVHAAARGAREGTAGRPQRDVLLPAVHRGLPARQGLPLPTLRPADRLEGPWPAVLLDSVPRSSAGRSRQDEAVSALRHGVRLLQRAAHLLLSPVRERRAFPATDRRRELAPQGRDQLRGVVPADAAAHLRAGRQDMPGLRAAGTTRGASPQRAALGQPAGEPDHALPDLPRGAPQVDSDTVSVVRLLHGERDTVYDLDVEGNRNFFAGQVLVHNCVILDDPVKGRREAESATIRESTWDVWENTIVPRLGPGAIVILMMTRWHTDDLAGRVLEREPGMWRVVSIPAIAEDADDPLGREPGEEMQSVRGRPPGYFHALADRMSPYVFRSVYQQRPTSAQGTMFLRDKWRYWTQLPGGQIDLDGSHRDLRDQWRVITCDLAGSTRTSADYTVAAVWALTQDGQVVLLDRVRERTAEADHWGLVRPLAERWQAPDVGVESTMMGTTLVRAAAAAGLRPFDLHADRDKITRAVPYSHLQKNKRVWLPVDAPWLDEWIGEHADFPNTAHDDQVDTGSYAARLAVAEWNPGGDPTPPIGERWDGDDGGIDFDTVPF